MVINHIGWYKICLDDKFNFQYLNNIIKLFKIVEPIKVEIITWLLRYMILNKIQFSFIQFTTSRHLDPIIYQINKFHPIYIYLTFIKSFVSILFI